MIVDKIKKREATAKNKKVEIDIPIGKWLKCDCCKEILYKETVQQHNNICPNCGNYFRMHIGRRIELIIDEGTYQRFDLKVETTNPLELEDYPKKLKSLREKTGLEEAVSCGTGKIKGENDMLEKLKEIIAEQLGIAADEIKAESNFKDDLGADSLDLFELVMSLEEEYGVEIPSEDLEKIATVNDVMEYLKAKGVEV